MQYCHIAMQMQVRMVKKIAVYLMARDKVLHCQIHVNTMYLELSSNNPTYAEGHHNHYTWMVLWQDKKSITNALVDKDNVQHRKMHTYSYIPLQ